MANIIRGIVSKNKKRFTQDGFDLDLTYVTPRIIAMGIPTTGIKSVYRNPLPEVYDALISKETITKQHYSLGEALFHGTTFWTLQSL